MCATELFAMHASVLNRKTSLVVYNTFVKKPKPNRNIPSIKNLETVTTLSIHQSQNNEE